MPAKHLSDVLFDYLFGTNYTSFSDEETGGISKTTLEGRDLKNKEMLHETKKR
jgi:hypothetical protein